MKRKDFLRKGLIGMGGIIAIPTVLQSCSSNKKENSTDDCALSPKETAGPFPIITPSELVQSNIILDRKGIAMRINIIIKDKSNDCTPLPNVYVDIWHCDAQGMYSEYGGNNMQREDYTESHFLRGRQLTNANGEVSFISIFPGWYPSRAPHIHVEVLKTNGRSIRVSQIAFEKETCETIYATANYNGTAQTQNNDDDILNDSLNGNMVDSAVGNITDGYTITKTIIV